MRLSFTAGALFVPLPRSAKHTAKTQYRKFETTQKSNYAATVLIPTFTFMWTIYIFPSQTHECGNWDWGRAIPLLGIHKSKFLCSAVVMVYIFNHFAVYCPYLCWLQSNLPLLPQCSPIFGRHHLPPPINKNKNMLIANIWTLHFWFIII